MYLHEKEFCHIFLYLCTVIYVLMMGGKILCPRREWWGVYNIRCRLRGLFILVPLYQYLIEAPVNVNKEPFFIVQLNTLWILRFWIPTTMRHISLM